MDSENRKHVLVTGGAGYIGSLLTSVLLNHGCQVTVVDDLLFGGEPLLGYWHHPRFRFVKGNVCDSEVLREALTPDRERLTPERVKGSDPPSAVVHLAAIVGFPACQAVGREVAWHNNVEATQRVFEAAETAGVERFIFSSTYSNYGVAPDGQPVTEDSPLYPQSLYAETKIAAEQFLLEHTARSRCAPVVYRFSTLFGISPRTRFDLIVNQFVLEALTKHQLIIYQRGYTRSFVHVRDVVEAILLALEADLSVVRGQIFNVGSDLGNYTKDEIIELVRQHVDRVEVEYKDMAFQGDMRNMRVCFAKIRNALGFEIQTTVGQGIVEVRDAITSGLIRNPLDTQYRNAKFIVQ